MNEINDEMRQMLRHTKRLIELVIDLGENNPKVLGDTLVGQSLLILFLEDELGYLTEILVKNGIDPKLSARDRCNPSTKMYGQATAKAADQIEDMQRMNEEGTH